MVNLIVGPKGTGKTKALIAAATEAARISKGNVVCIEKGDSLKFDIHHKVRLVDIEEYKIVGADAYFGFLAGLLAGNYDITEIFGDATFRVVCGKDKKDFEQMAAFLQRVNELAVKNQTKVIFTLSCDAAELPDSIKGMIQG